MNLSWQESCQPEATAPKRPSPSNQEIDNRSTAGSGNFHMEDESSNQSSTLSRDMTKRARVGSIPTKEKQSYKSGENDYSIEQEEGKSPWWPPRGIAGCRRTNDEVHQVISFCPVMSAIIDTRTFQRLRGLKQLATAYFVYNNGNHSRFEHSLGVAHLAEKLITNIRKQQPAMRNCTTEKDVLCVKLAGLLHDLGHGPFSHTFESFVKRAPEYQSFLFGSGKSGDNTFNATDNGNHESCSLRMIDFLLLSLGLQIDESRLDKPLKQVGFGMDRLAMRVYPNDFEISNRDQFDEDDEMILTSQDWIYIKELILGGPLPGKTGIVGRPHYSYAWTYDIVANKNSGLDVDKIDYYARDDRRCCRESGEIKKHFIEEAFVAWVSCTNITSTKIECSPEHIYEGRRLMICYPRKSEPKVLNFFRDRYELHRKIYQHKTCIAANLMLIEIFCLADPYFHLPNDEGSNNDDENERKLPAILSGGVPLSKAMMYPQVFVKLEDSVIDAIEFTTEPRLGEARRIIQRFKSRNLYRHAGGKSLNANNETHRSIWRKNEFEIKRDMLAIHGIHDDGIILHDLDFSVVKVEYHYGQKEKNPLLNVRFISKKTQIPELMNPLSQLPEAGLMNLEEIEDELPSSFMKREIRVYSRSTDSKVTNLLTHIFEQWWAQAHSTMELNTSDIFEEISGRECANVGSANLQAVLLTQDSDLSEEEDNDDDGSIFQL